MRPQIKTTMRHILDHWEPWFKDHGVCLDTPSCWACGEFWIDRSKHIHTNYVKAWEGSAVQRCHIVPFACGGLDSPSNYFLLCARCHDVAPNTTSVEMFMRWVSRQENWYTRRERRMREELHTFSMDVEDLPYITSIMNSPDFKEWYIKNTTTHFRTTGRSDKYATQFAAVAAFTSDPSVRQIA